MEQLLALVTRAGEIKSGSAVTALRGKQFVPFFFNPSLRTRVSFESACARYGAHCISLSPGADTWQFEYREGVRMDGVCAEHLKEAVRVVSRYAQCLAVRSFAGLKNLNDDLREDVLQAFLSYATVPVVNLESAMEHPCQALADMLTITEQCPEYRGKRFVLSWAPHIKPLPLAVPHSAILTAAALGMNVSMCHPEGYDLAPGFVELAGKFTRESGGSLSVSHDQRRELRDADIVYVKSWGTPKYYGDSASQGESFSEHSDWMVSREKLAPLAKVMHCLPVRRNVVVTDDVLDSEQAIVIDQAENRLWAQVAILEHVVQA